MEIKENKMAKEPLKKLYWKMGLPMIVSMILQALYNVVDSIFVANMSTGGAIANEALTYAFPIQILIIAVGVGTGIGLNALLSKSLGEKNQKLVNKIAGNGIFLAIILYLVFLLFGLFGSRWFISLFSNNEEVINLGTEYLTICSSLSLGAIAYAIYERFLQSTGKTMHSTIAQISGAVTNIVFDYVFIFPLNMGVAGAAWATVMGQFVSLIIGIIFHHALNKEINFKIKDILPSFNIIKGIYQIGISAAIMQALLSVMMAGVNAILGTANVSSTILVGSFGIYYKIQQIALFAAFGLSNTIITILSFNYGMKDKKRSEECIKYGIIDTLIVMLVITILFEIIANPLAKMFALSGGDTVELINVCEKAIRIAAIGYIFMGYSVAIQGVLQALRYALRPLATAFLRLIVFVFPLCYLFTLSSNVIDLVWWSFPIAEALTAFISFFILKRSIKEKIKPLKEVASINNNLIITISREHGTNGKHVAKLLSDRLNIKFYDKELTLKEAKARGLNEKYIDENKERDDYLNYLSLDANKESLIAQKEVILDIASKENSIFIGRAADYYLKDFPNLITIFLYAPIDFKINKLNEIYGDNKEEALKNIEKSNKRRSEYYALISNKTWGDKLNYNLYLDASKNEEEIIEEIISYINKKMNTYY